MSFGAVGEQAGQRVCFEPRFLSFPCTCRQVDTYAPCASVCPVCKREVHTHCKPAVKPNMMAQRLSEQRLPSGVTCAQVSPGLGLGDKRPF